MDFEASLDTMEVDADNLEVSLNTLLESSNVDTSELSVKNDFANYNVKLPSINLPEFSGQYIDWLQFKSQFVSLIHDNACLSDSQKLYHLQSALKGHAKQLQTVNDSYSSLFEALEGRYENKRLIVNSHIAELLNPNKIKFESAFHLRSLIDSIQSHLRALKQLELEPNALCESMLIFVITQRPDDESRKQYETELHSTDLPKWNNFLDFLIKRSQALENVQRNSSLKNKNEYSPKFRSFVVKSDEKTCPLCPLETHPIFKYKMFHEMSVQERSNKVRSLNLCFNCLGHHLIKNCLKLNRKCRVCNANHNSLLCKTSVPRPISEPHQNRNLPSPQSSSGVIYDPSSATVINPQTATCLYNEVGEKSILLSTAKVKVQSATGGWLVMNAILDSGSQKCLCNLEASNFLGLKKYSTNSTIVGLNGACISVWKRISAEILNGSSFKRKLNFLIVPKITGCVPTQPLDLTKIKLRQNITFADAEFNIPKPIDILLGGEIFYELLKSKQIKLHDNSIILQDSVFGYIVTGSIQNEPSNYYFCNFIQDQVDRNLTKFWDLEAIGIKAESSCDPNDQAMQHFKSSVRFNSGRYEVGFPWKGHTQELNDNFSVAEKRVKSLTRRFIRDPTLYIQYSEILKEYEYQGIIERVLETEKPTDRAVFYLPHQAVFRQESLTTKMRIVFDASSHEDGQPSLNDCIWSGGNLNPNIFHLIISFRLNTIAITTDIERAFLQISLRDEDRDAVRFLFPDIRSNQTDPYKFQVYRFKRVMFGVNVSPFLLSATIKHHIENYREQYPAATEMLDTCLYVDDVISGADDISQALKVSKDAETIMKNASMKLRKWNSNDQTLIRTWEKEGLETHPRHPDDSSKIPSSKVLGIPWDVVHDYFTIDVKGLLQLDTSKPITKRIVLLSAGKIYDPVGFLSPYTIRLKCLLQELWLRKLSWDDELPPDIHAVWSQWWLELPFLSELKIPRNILDSSGDSSEVQIHTFSDASQKAYGEAAFLRVKHKDRVSVDLVTSKSRVAPLKRLSLPRLELMGALLAARLAKEVKKILDQKCSTRAFFWTDSQVTLHWIKGPSHRWKLFVANRVREIQSLTDPNSWFHCSGKDKPADLLTRGISVDALTTNSKWWNGSSFLRQIDFQTKGLDEAIPERVYLTEMRKNSNPKEDISLTLTVTKNNFLENIIDISNNYVKLIRVVSFLYRFMHLQNQILENQNYKDKGTPYFTGGKSCWLIHSLHEREFYEEMRKLLAVEPIPMKSKLTPLNVFLDESNIIRVGGRLANSNLNEKAKFPMILPSRNVLTDNILSHYHKKYLHAGPHSLLYLVRQKFWPLNGRNNCRRIIHECVNCFKNKPITMNQIMTNLPRDRVTPNYPFNVTDVDFAGPFFIKFKNQRKGALNKIYVVVYVCLCTKAIHLDFVTDLTSQAFITSLKRFFGRRGKCAKITTDNAKTFVGANAEIKKLFKMIKLPDHTLAEFLTNESIEWNFIPPRSPNHGGLWEAGVKAFKFHLKRVVGNAHLTLEEFITILCEIEAVLNSRPLTPLTSNFDDFETLTPGHFLVGRPLTSIVEVQITNINENQLSRWEKVKKLPNIYIYKLWKRDYLNNLQERHKWKFNKNNISVGTLVLIKDENLPSTKWSTGRITELFPGTDSFKILKKGQVEGHFSRKDRTYKRRMVCHLRVPSHIELNGNEIADSLAKSATADTLRRDTCLTFAELSSIK
ncbi:integrase catalytic domain-containing protein [Trichonephila clavipes]|nr:integrase catalytic domain-containing protein [Trichonephila clavipes]